MPHDQINPNVPNVARIWNYWLGGKDNYPADREMGEKITDINPQVASLARHSRVFLGRAVRHLAGECGIRQFLDIGTGLPTVDNTHEIAQRVAPECRIVYVDNDPLVLAHARALLTSTPDGVTDYVDADVCDPQTILREASKTLNFAEPIAIMLMGIMEFVVDDQEAYSIINRLLSPLPAGSYLALYDGTAVIHPQASTQTAQAWNSSGNAPLVLRSPSQIAQFFDGLELLEPGIVTVSRWRPEPTHVGEPPEVDAFGGLGRKPTSGGR